MRGLAIMGIVLHNYCHWLGFAVKENEFTFSSEKTDALWQAIASPDALLPVHLLSYFGHYGVPVFLFLSGFGLVMKYENGTAMPPARRFVRYHYLKLLRIMMPGFVAFTVVDAITPGTFHYRTIDIIAELLMAINLLPEPEKTIWPGPYWFFGLMMQLYVLYRLWLSRCTWKQAITVGAACWIAQLFCQPDGNILNYLRYNCVGAIPVFAAGILAARHGSPTGINAIDKRKWAGIAMACAVLLTIGCLLYPVWMATPIAVAVATVAAIKILPDAVLRPLTWLGGVSAAMFVVHPMLRKVFIPISRRGDVYEGLLLYVVATVAISWAFTVFISKIPKPRP